MDNDTLGRQKSFSSRFKSAFKRKDSEVNGFDRVTKEDQVVTNNGSISANGSGRNSRTASGRNSRNGSALNSRHGSETNLAERIKRHYITGNLSVDAGLDRNRTIRQNDVDQHEDRFGDRFSGRNDAGSKHQSSEAHREYEERLAGRNGGLHDHDDIPPRSNGRQYNGNQNSNQNERVADVYQNERVSNGTHKSQEIKDSTNGIQYNKRINIPKYDSEDEDTTTYRTRRKFGDRQSQFKSPERQADRQQFKPAENQADRQAHPNPNLNAIPERTQSARNPASSPERQVYSSDRISQSGIGRGSQTSVDSIPRRHSDNIPRRAPRSDFDDRSSDFGISSRSTGTIHEEFEDVPVIRNERNFGRNRYNSNHNLYEPQNDQRYNDVRHDDTSSLSSRNTTRISHIDKRNRNDNDDRSSQLRSGKYADDDRSSQLRNGRYTDNDRNSQLRGYDEDDRSPHSRNPARMSQLSINQYEDDDPSFQSSRTYGNPYDQRSRIPSSSSKQSFRQYDHSFDSTQVSDRDSIRSGGSRFSIFGSRSTSSQASNSRSTQGNKYKIKRVPFNIFAKGV